MADDEEFVILESEAGKDAFTLALEAIAADGEHEPYVIVIDQLPSESIRVNAREMIWQIVEDIGHGVPASIISARFHQTLIRTIIEVCRRVRSSAALDRVCLSRECFQNVRPLDESIDGLKSEGFKVYFPRRVPANDGGISLGQAAIACELLRLGT